MFIETSSKIQMVWNWLKSLREWPYEGTSQDQLDRTAKIVLEKGLGPVIT